MAETQINAPAIEPFAIAYKKIENDLLEDVMKVGCHAAFYLSGVPADKAKGPAFKALAEAYLTGADSYNLSPISERARAKLTTELVAAMHTVFLLVWGTTKEVYQDRVEAEAQAK